MSVLGATRIAIVVFVVAVAQVSAFSSVTVGRAAPDILLLTLVSIALLRGSVAGAVVGFAAGLVVDLATLGTLGLTSLLLTVAGYWAGRYGETTGRGRAYAPLATVLAATVFMEFAGYGLRSLLGEPVSAGSTLVVLPAALLWNALLAYPVLGFVRRLAGTHEQVERVREVELLV